jgi:uncharacterized membrane protein YbhN (UPF0104 family)
MRLIMTTCPNSTTSGDRRRWRASEQVGTVCKGGEVSVTPDGRAAGPAEDQVDGPPPGRWRTLGWRLALGVVTVIAVVVLGRRLAAADLGHRLQSAHLGWVAVAVGLSLLPIVGSTLSLVALTPGRLPYRRTLAVQLATSFVNLVTPASAGGFALNMRYLHRRGIPLAVAVAAVGLVQSTAVLVTAVLLVCLLLASGRQAHLGSHLPWPIVLAAVGLLAVIAVTVLAWPWGRAWLSRTVLAPARAAWPPLRTMLSSPARVATAIGGHLIVTLGFAGTLAAAVCAFGGSASFVLLTLVVVGSSALAGAAPVPGGIGAAEAALLTGLVAVGVDASVGLSAALLYRLVTFWARVPVGWLALVLLRRRGAV